MAKRQHRKIRRDNELNVYRHVGEWWKVCARVDVDALRASIHADEFNKRRAYRLCLQAKKLESWERETLKQLVAEEQLRRYKSWKVMERAWKARGVEF